MNRSFVTLLVGLAVAIVAIGAYWDAFDNEFIWDDPIIFNRQLPYFDSLGNVFQPPKSIPQFGTHYYRPLTIVSFQVDEWISKTFWPLEQREQARRQVYHASVIFYHGLASILVFLLAIQLARISGFARDLALAAGVAAGLLFAVHPIHVECVAWMAGRTDVLCAVFVMAALMTYIRHRQHGRWPDLVAAAGFTLAAMLTKETGVGLLLALPFVDLLLPAAGESGSGGKAGKALSRAERRRAQRRRGSQSPSNVPMGGFGGIALRWGAVALAAVVYFGLRSGAIPSGHLRSSGRSLGSLFGALGWYVKKLFWPPPQSAFVTDTPGGLYAALGAIVLLAAAGVAYFAWRKKSAFGEAVAVVLLLATLAPSLAIVVYRISETPLAERYLYTPSVALCVLLGLLLARAAMLIAGSWPSPARMALTLVPALVLAVPMVYGTLQREQVWQNNLVFWKDTAAKAPGQGLPHLHLGLTYNEMDYTDKALAEYQLALEEYDDAEGRSKAYNNMGSVYIGTGQLDKAVEALEGAIREVPNYPTAYYNLALCRVRKAQQTRNRKVQTELINEALGGFQRALKINPRYVKAHFQYGRLLVRLGKSKLGREHLRRVIKLAPSSREAKAAKELLGG